MLCKRRPLLHVAEHQGLELILVFSLSRHLLLLLREPLVERESRLFDACLQYKPQSSHLVPLLAPTALTVLFELFSLSRFNSSCSARCFSFFSNHASKHLMFCWRFSSSFCRLSSSDCFWDFLKATKAQLASFGRVRWVQKGPYWADG